MSRSFVIESDVSQKIRKKSSRPKFLTCSSEGTSSDTNSTNEAINKSKAQRSPTICGFRGSRCLNFINTRPPPSPNNIQKNRKPTSTTTKSNVPSLNGSNNIIPRSSNVHSSTHSFDRNGMRKSLTSFQSFSARIDENMFQDINQNINYATLIKKSKTDIQRQYSSLQRPKYFDKLDCSSDNEMDPNTLRPRENFIRRSAKPDMDSLRRKEYSLKLMIEAISNVASKKRYHCELKLNNRTYARTSSRVAEKGEATWNEIYELCNLSPVTSATINLYKEMIEGKGGKKKNTRHKIAFVTMAIEDLCERHEVKKKLPMQKCMDDNVDQNNTYNLCVGANGKTKQTYFSDSSDSEITRGDYISSSLPRESCSGSTRSNFMRYLRSRKDGDIPAVSISAKYQCIEILPLTSYHDLSEFMLHNYQSLVMYLDDKLSGRRLEEVASSIVSIQELAGNAPKFITSSICSKVETVNYSTPVFLRANTIGSKAIESYMKLVGMEYLKSILGDFAIKILTYPSSLEVDPSRLDDKSFLKLTQVQLCSMVQSLFQNISSSTHIFPIELRRVFCALRRCLEQHNSSELADQLLSSCIFLRFICPAILNPYLYQLIQEYPQDPRIIRNFTLISKSLQTLANQTGPDNAGPSLKEPFMVPIHESLSKERIKMISFLREISSETPQSRTVLQSRSKWYEYIDVGFELAVSHLYLSEVFVTDHADQTLPPELHPLIPILNNISTLLCSSLDLQSSTKGMAEILSKSCKLLVDNVNDPAPNFTSTYTNKSSTREMTKQRHLNSTRKNSVPLELDKYWNEKKDIKRSTTRHTLTVNELNSLWKNLVERAEDNLLSPEQLPRFDIDLDPDFHMEYQYCLNGTEETSPLRSEINSIPSSGLTPTSQNLTLDTSLNCDIHSLDNESPIIYYPPPPPIDTLPTNPSAQKQSPTKLIKMGTKAVQTQPKKPANELDAMRRMVTEAEIKYLRAKKEMEDKEEENRILRELLRSQTGRCQNDSAN